MEQENISEQVQTELDENNIQSSDTKNNEIQTDSADKSEEKTPEINANFSQNEKSTEITEKDKEQRILNEVLEKLNIKEQEQKNSKENFFNDILAQNQLKYNVDTKEKNTKLRQIVSSDMAKIAKFVQQGIINPSQGQNLKKLVLKKAFDKYIQYGLKPKEQNNFKQTINQQIQMPNSDSLNEFLKTKPDFFNKDGRKDVLDYLKTGGINLGQDDLHKISAMIENVEKTAIDRYLKKSAYEKNLQESNESAKQKLKANAQNSSFADGASRTFTRKQIGKMSSSDFIKNETAIMEQLRKGLIK